MNSILKLYLVIGCVLDFRTLTYPLCFCSSLKSWYLLVGSDLGFISLIMFIKSVAVLVSLEA